MPRNSLYQNIWRVRKSVFGLIKQNLTRVTNTAFNPAGPENFKTDSNEAGLLSRFY